MRILIACEFSGVVRRAFRGRGHDAWSCDLEPAEDGSPYHIQGDAIEASQAQPWDLMIAHPPCTHLACSGAAWFAKKQHLQGPALDFVRQLMDAPIARIAIENPVSIISTRIRKPEQIIQPYQFGHPESKKTCLWLKGLPKLEATRNVAPEEVIVSPGGSRMTKWFYDSWKLPKAERTKLRNRTFLGIADAMASQWGALEVINTE